MLVTINSSSPVKLDWGAKGKERVIQNVQNILNTRKYEVAYNRDFGISPDIIDTDIYTMRSMIEEDLRKNIAQYEPRANLVSVDVQITDGEAVVIVGIEV